MCGVAPMWAFGFGDLSALPCAFHVTAGAEALRYSGVVVFFF